MFFDEPLARDLYDRFGDFVVGYMLGGAWSEAAQQALDSPLAGEERALARRLPDRQPGSPTSSPTRTATTAREAAVIEPGDLDEAIQTALVVGDETSTDDVARQRFREDRQLPRGRARWASTPAPPASATDSVTGAAGPLAALDIGTNSFHLVVARPVGGDRFETLTREKEVVRLGHGGGDMKVMTAEAIDRGIACLRRMRRIADSYGATLRAVATSAVREAANAQAFLDRARTEAGIDIEVISGAEEARLIHLGVLQAVPVFDRRLLLVDIGGGSTELLLGQRGETLAARSFKLGAVRLTDRFFPGGDVTPRRRHRLPGVRAGHPQPLPAGRRRSTASTSPSPRPARPRRSPTSPTPPRAPSRCGRTTASSSPARS